MNRQNKTDRLYRAIGGIDDRFLAEAMEAAPKKKAKILRKRTVIALIAAVLGICILGGVFIASRISLSDNQRTSVLEKVMPKREDAAGYAGDVDFYSGNNRLLWKYAGSDQIYSRTITASELRSLQNCQADAQRVGDGSVETVRIWLCDSDGNVSTPFLISSQGNTAQGEIFDYEPELEVTETTADFLADLFT